MPDETSSQPIRPLHDVWLRPRRVFRELAGTPIGRLDYVLGAAQGAVSWLALCRAQSAGSGDSVADILGKALVIGPIAGVVGLYLMAAIYTQLGKRLGSKATRQQIFHVLAYSGVPMLASLGIWLVTAVLVGDSAFLQSPRANLEPFLSLVLHAQFIAHGLLVGWSLLLQVMGLSEVMGIWMRRAFGAWLLGQVIAAAALFLFAILLLSLGLGAGTGGPPL